MASVNDRNKQYSIFISSGLKAGQLKVYCMSFVTTKGEVKHVLEPGKSFAWDFEAPIMQPPDCCNFKWKNKEINLNVWNGYHGATCGETTTHWAVLEDGFYFRRQYLGKNRFGTGETVYLVWGSSPWA